MCYGWRAAELASEVGSQGSLCRSLKKSCATGCALALPETDCAPSGPVSGRDFCGGELCGGPWWCGFAGDQALPCTCVPDALSVCGCQRTGAHSGPVRGAVASPRLQMGTLRHTAVPPPAQDHTGGKWGRWGAHPGVHCG